MHCCDAYSTTWKSHCPLLAFGTIMGRDFNANVEGRKR